MEIQQELNNELLQLIAKYDSKIRSQNIKRGIAKAKARKAMQAQ